MRRGVIITHCIIVVRSVVDMHVIITGLSDEQMFDGQKVD